MLQTHLPPQNKPHTYPVRRSGTLRASTHNHALHTKQVNRSRVWIGGIRRTLHEDTSISFSAFISVAVID